jgi:hypothetical protein
MGEMAKTDNAREVSALQKIDNTRQRLQILHQVGEARSVMNMLVQKSRRFVQIRNEKRERNESS